MTDESRGSKLGPGKLAPEEGSPFLLNQREWYAIQRYVASVLALPDTEEKMRFSLAKVENEQKTPYIGDFAEFKNLLTGYQTIIPHVRKWKEQIFPTTVDLAKRVSEYAMRAERHYGALRSPIDLLLSNPSDKEAKDRVAMICGGLAKTASEYESQASAVYKAILEFSEATQKDEQLLKALALEYEGRYGKQSAAMQAWEKEMTKLRTEIEELNKEYEHACIVAKTTPTYAWLNFLIALIIASVYGKRAAEFKNEIDIKAKRLNELGDDTARALMLTATLSMARSGLKDIQEQIAAALPCVQKIQGVWYALAGELTTIGLTIKNDILAEDDTFLKSLNVELAIDQWKDCKVKADGYQANAFITVNDLAEAA